MKLNIHPCKHLETYVGENDDGAMFLCRAPTYITIENGATILRCPECYHRDIEEQHK